jgi:RNA polymerase sigma factor (sigma-70 family)
VGCHGQRVFGEHSVVSAGGRDDEAPQQLRGLIVAHHTGIVRRLAFRLGDRDLAEDLAQEVWVRVARDPRIIVDHEHPLDALGQITWNVLRNHERKQRRRGEQRLPDDTIAVLADNGLVERLLRGARRFGPDRRSRDSRAVPLIGTESAVDPMRSVDLQADLRNAMRDLSWRQQEALYLYYQEELSPQAIGLLMGMSRQGASKRDDEALDAALRRLGDGARITHSPDQLDDVYESVLARIRPAPVPDRVVVGESPLLIDEKDLDRRSAGQSEVEKPSPRWIIR